MAGGGHGTRAVVAALLANLGIAVAKFVGFVLTRSASMLAEGVHSVADSGNQALLLFGHKRAQRPATPQHPFGFGRERYFWAFVVALILFSLGGMFAIVEGVSKIRNPHELESASIAIGILVLGILLESGSFRTAVIEGRRAKQPGTSWWGFVRGTKQPELPVVLLEDLGALIGLVLALVAIIVTEVTDNALWDGVGTLSIGILLVIIAVILAVEMKGLLMGEAASPGMRQKIVGTIAADPGVAKLIHLRTQHIGPDDLLVGAKLELAGELSADEAVNVVNRVEASVRQAVPVVRIMYVEPDTFRTAPAPEAAASPPDGTDADVPVADAPGDGAADPRSR